MTSKVVLNNVDHHDLKVVPRFGAEFGDHANQVLLLPTEFQEAQREFPILFRRDTDGSWQAVALLGLDRDENLFLDAGGWRTRYVPALLQRGPFSIGMPEGSAGPMVYVDLDDPRVGRDEGLPLFLPQGGNAPYLNHIQDMLQAIYAGSELAGPMYAAFDAAGLIEPVTLEIMLNEVERYDLPDHCTISPERLASLDGAELEQLNRSGYLAAAFLVAASINNISRLIDLKNARRAAA